MENTQQPTQNQQTMSVGEWIVTFILTAIPVVNLIMLFTWAFGSGTNPSKANWAKASLILMLIGLVLGIIIWTIVLTAFASASSYM